MALIGPDRCQRRWDDGSCGHTALYALLNCNANDTVDLAADFQFVKRAGIVSDTGATIGACSISNSTVLSIPVGPANDGVWLLAVGVAR